MEPKDPNKKYQDLLRNINFSFMVPATVPVGTYKFPVGKKEAIQEELVRYYEIDEMLDAMTEYPQAKKMLDKLYGML